MPTDPVQDEAVAALQSKTLHLQQRVDVLDQQYRDAAEQFSQMFQTLSDHELALQKITATLEQRGRVANCPKCGTRYRGSAPPGQRSCPAGCGQGRF